MQWIVRLNGERPERGLRWVRAFLRGYRTDALEWVRIGSGRGKYQGVYGRCWLPTRERPTFRISCQVPGPFPCEIVIRKPPLYPRENGTFPKAPPGCRRTVRCFDARTGRQWYRVVGRTRLETLDEAIVWIVGHEAFHYLKGTKQIRGRDNEIEADRLADEQLRRFREEASTAVEKEGRPGRAGQLVFPWKGGA